MVEEYPTGQTFLARAGKSVGIPWCFELPRTLAKGHPLRQPHGRLQCLQKGWGEIVSFPKSFAPLLAGVVLGYNQCCNRKVDITRAMVGNTMFEPETGKSRKDFVE